jgi:hypothetical protein
MVKDKDNQIAKRIEAVEREFFGILGDIIKERDKKIKEILAQDDKKAAKRILKDIKG